MSKQAKPISDYIELPTLELTVPVQTQGTTVLLGTRVGRQTVFVKWATQYWVVANWL